MDCAVEGAGFEAGPVREVAFGGEADCGDEGSTSDFGVVVA